jgi:hypothetical protein
MVRLGLAQPFRNLWVLLTVILAFTITAGWLIVLFFAAQQPQSVPAFALGNRIYRDGFYNFFLFSMILMVLSSTVGSSLIARDLRTHALVLYFSRAITRADYLAGKFLTLFLFLLAATLGPGLVLFLGQLGVGSEKLSFGQRLADLGAVTGHAFILTVPMTAVVLAFSSITTRASVAGLLWAVFFFASWTFSTILQALLRQDWCAMVSWMNLTAHLADHLYPKRASLLPSEPVLACGWVEPLAILGGATLISLGVVWRRLQAVEARE